jgi:hypothetical protein
MTYEGLGEMVEGDSADTCCRIFPLMSMGGRAEGLASADPVARTTIGTSRFFLVAKVVSVTERFILLVTMSVELLGTDKSSLSPPKKYYKL